MDKYKINLVFNKNGKSLNEIVINVLKIELEKQDKTCNILSNDISLEATCYYQSEKESINEYQ